MKNTELILFDFDGTIVDTGEGITKGVAYALSGFGIEVTNLSALHAFIGPPLKDSFQEFYNFSDEEVVRATAAYREYYKADGMRQCRPYDGVEVLLRRLREAGKLVLLATSKPQHFAELILKNFDLLQYFDYVAGSTLDEKRTDKAEVIAYALEQYPNMPRERMLMVGDRKYDILGAKTEGLRSVGVLYGFGSRAEFEEAGADYIAADMVELEALLL